MSSINDDWFVIKDLKNFVDYSRKLVYKTYGSKDEKDQEPDDLDNLIQLTNEEQNELDNILSYNETMGIVKSFAKIQRNKKTKKIRFTINEKLYADIIQSLGDRMTSNILRNLVSKGVVETAYDSDLDDFIFWIKEENNGI